MGSFNSRLLDQNNIMWKDLSRKITYTSVSGLQVAMFASRELVCTVGGRRYMLDRSLAHFEGVISPVSPCCPWFQYLQLIAQTDSLIVGRSKIGDSRLLKNQVILIDLILIPARSRIFIVRAT
jgi:hypothetical protein